jgi:hypothetical protein
MDWGKFGSIGIKLIPFVVAAVHGVESISDSFKDKDVHGKQKQDAALDAIGAMINSIELTAGTELMGKDDFKELVRHLINDYVAIQNYIGQFNLQKSNNLTK